VRVHDHPADVGVDVLGGADPGPAGQCPRQSVLDHVLGVRGVAGQDVGESEHGRTADGDVLREVVGHAGSPVRHDRVRRQHALQTLGLPDPLRAAFRHGTPIDRFVDASTVAGTRLGA
jgi:hypothetical protein